LCADESCGLDWDTRYKIIKGICEGLNYLHNGSSNPIYHLDLKPSNILLDKSMIPKIADLGLSRFFATTKTHITSQIKGTL
ncbi:Os11g0608400, partial [Oryza sativa Japonica Group]